jgi:hypothetical protein
MEGLQDEEELTVDEVIILITKIFSFELCMQFSDHFLGNCAGFGLVLVAREQRVPYRNLDMNTFHFRLQT